MHCPSCGKKLADDAHFCTDCGARVDGSLASSPKAENELKGFDGFDIPPIDDSKRDTFSPPKPSDEKAGEEGKERRGTTPREVPAPAPGPRQERLSAKVVVAALTAIVVCGILVGGFLTNWYGIPDLASGQSDEQDAPAPEESSSIPVRASVDEYSWSELSQISSEIASSPSMQEAIGIAHGYNLCGAQGELVGMPSKTVTLSNGAELHARIIGFRHDQRDDGSMAGITFLFDEAVALNSWSLSGYNAGGWEASSIRSWLSMTFFETLPEDLRDEIVTVLKQTNNTGGVDTGTLPTSVVTTTPDKLWLPSHVEVAGTSEENRHWPTWRYGDQYTWCDDIAAAEGAQYALFSQAGIVEQNNNPTLVRTYEGSPCRWWLRTPNPHISNDSLLVSAEGHLFDDAGPIESQGVVPGFCI